MLSKKWNFVVGLFFVFLVTNLSIADWKDNAKAVKISGGADHSLVLTEDKHPWGCGYNLYYQLGTGDTINKTTPVHVYGPLANITDISAGFTHSLALDVNNTVLAWGYNNNGQLGDNSTESAPTPTYVHGYNNTGYLTNIVAISASKFGSASGYHSLAVDANGLCYGWGYNAFGQLGVGSSYSTPQKTPIKVHAGEQNPGHPNYDIQDIISVSAGEDQSMVLDANGFVFCFGQNMGLFA